MTDYTDTDMIEEAASAPEFAGLGRHTELRHGIVRRYINLKSKELADSIGRAQGVYITFDCTSAPYRDADAADALIGYIADAVRELTGILKRNDPVLIAGLGNRRVSADALGPCCIDGIASNRQAGADRPRGVQCVCTIEPGVYGITGVQSAEAVRAVAEEIKPCICILIDAFATSSVRRLGCSFQLSTTGIVPGSGVGRDRERIDKSVLKIPVFTIGVPMVLGMRGAVYSFVKKYLEDTGERADEFRLRARLAECGYGNLSVQPKEIHLMTDTAAYVISGAINRAFSLKR